MVEEQKPDVFVLELVERRLDYLLSFCLIRLSRKVTDGNKNKGEGSSFVKQAGILAAAGIICRIIGLLYRSPDGNYRRDRKRLLAAGVSLLPDVLLISS